MAFDADYDKRILILPCSGADNSVVFTDYSKSPKSITVSGNTKIKANTSYFNGSAAYFDGTGDYLTLPTLEDFDFTNRNIRIEFFIKTGQTLAYACPLGKDTGAFTAGTWAFLLNGPQSGALQFWNASYSTGEAMLSAAAAATNNNA